MMGSLEEKNGQIKMRSLVLMAKRKKKKKKRGSFVWWRGRKRSLFPLGSIVIASSCTPVLLSPLQSSRCLPLVLRVPSQGTSEMSRKPTWKLCTGQICWSSKIFPPATPNLDLHNFWPLHGPHFIF